MEDNIKIYKYLVIFLWIFSVVGVFYYYRQGDKCSGIKAVKCHSAASLNTSNFKQAGESFPDLEGINRSKKEILNLNQ